MPRGWFSGPGIGVLDKRYQPLGAPGVVTATLVVAAVDSKDTARADYVCDGTADESEINTALNALPAEGGRVILLETPTSYKIATPIVIPDDNIVLEGQGRSSKLFLVNSANDNVIEIGDGATNITGAVVRNLEIDGNKANNTSGHGVLFNGVDYKATIYNSKVKNCYIHDCEDCGVYGVLTEDSVVRTCDIDNNNECGVYFRGLLRPTIIENNIHTNVDSNVKLVNAYSVGSGANVSNNIIHLGSNYSIEVNGVSKSIYSNNNISGGKGIFIDNAAANPDYTVLMGNLVVDTLATASYAIYLDTTGESTIANNVVINSLAGGIYCQTAARSSITGNVVTNPAGHGLVIDDSIQTVVSGNVTMGAAANMSNIRIEGNSAAVLVGGNNVYASGKSKYGIEIVAPAIGTSVIGNQTATGGLTASIIDGGSRSYITDNAEEDIIVEKIVKRVKNTSGAALANGDIVILKSVAAGNELTTTAVQGNDKVYGMAVEAIANNALGWFQTIGKTTALKVNGTVAIAIGDFIGTYTVAKIGMKAAVGDMAFAIALEAYAVADSNGVIDAMLIEPRKI